MNKKILLIEDNEELRENTSEILELDGFKVITASNGKKGVELAISEVPDLIICDIMMPELDGYGVLHMLSKNENTADIPFIFLTAKAERGDFRKGMEMGADDYITKPFDDMELLNAIESRFKKVESLKKKFESGMPGLDGMIRELGGEQELEKLKQDRKIKVFKKKAEIYREGDYPNYLFCVNKGKVKTYKVNDDGKELIIQLYSEGDFFGYHQLLGDTIYSESAAALEETELSLIPKTEFFELILKNRQVAQIFMSMLTKDIKENEEQLIKLAYNSVRKRVSEALLKFYDKADQVNGLFRISREDISNVAGTSLETAIRTLSDFKDEKLIDIISGKIKYLDVERLRKLRN